MAQVKLRPKLVTETINVALGRKSKSTDVEQLHDENRINEVISGDNNISDKLNNHFVNIGNTYGYFFDSYMSSADAFRFSTGNYEYLETTVGSLKNLPPGHDKILSSVLKEFVY